MMLLEPPIENTHLLITLLNIFLTKLQAVFLLKKEIDFLGNALNNPKRPFYAIIGGAKVSSKIGIIKSLLKKVDKLFIGGGMAYTFLKAKGMQIGKSIVEEDQIENAKKLLQEYANKIFLPKDIVIADKYDNDANSKTITTNENIEKMWEGLDIGIDTTRKWKKELADAKTIFWNGPGWCF